jgi:cell fate regulator YaaT (PSP1 superfamily)
MTAENPPDYADAAEAAPERTAPGGGGRERQDHATVVVRYGAMAWVGTFVYKRRLLERCPRHLVVQTERGIELGETVDFCAEGCPLHIPDETIQRYVANSGPEFCRPNAGRVLRAATPQDIDENARLNAHTSADITLCSQLAVQFGLDIKVILAEHLLGGERIVFYFAAETRVDFRDLVKELARHYHTRIEMRQVGARDEARLVADWEVCGRECCCKNFLKKLRPVNMKMAKLQKSTLDPSKVSGRCGRLRCCLRYEHEGYAELAARLPHRGSRVRTDTGEATVIDTQVLTQLVLVQYDAVPHQTAVPLEEIREFNLPRPKPVPAPPPTPPPAVVPPEPEPAPAAPSTPEESAKRGRRRRRRRTTPEPSEQAPRREPQPPATQRRADAAPPPKAERGSADSHPTKERADTPQRGRRRRRRRPGGKPGPDAPGGAGPD